MSVGIAESKWRNFIPYAPELTFEVYRGSPTNLPLLEHLVQGARDFDTGAKDQQVLDDIQSQRGWLCKYFNISRPTRGYLKNNLRSDGFEYTSNPLYVGSDCFSYVLNMGNQNSHPGKININVHDFMSGRIIVEEDKSRRETGVRYYRFILQWYIPPEFGNFSIIMADWYMYRPERYEREGGLYVRTVREKLASTSVTRFSSFMSGGRIQYYKRNHTWPANGQFHRFEWPDPLLAKADDERSGEPYVQPLGAFTIEVELSFRNWTKELMSTFWGYQAYYWYSLRWSEIYDIKFDITQLLGKNWWRSGYPIDVNDPNFVRNYPGTYVPELIIEPEPPEEPAPDTPVIDPDPSWYIDVDFQNRISGGWGHTIIMRPDDTAFGAGLSVMGQIAVPSGVVFEKIHAGDFISMGIDETGILHVWGYNILGFVDDSPAGMDDFKDMSSGAYFGMALRNTGEVIGWFSNSSGDGTSGGTTNDGSTYTDADDPLTNMPVYDPASTEPKIVALACGGRHTLALKEDGTLAQWGTYPSGNTFAVPTESNFVHIAAGGSQSMAVTDTGQIVSWASNSEDVPAGDNWRTVVCGLRTAVALHKDGHIEAWGNNTDGDVTDAPTDASWADTKFVDIIAGDHHYIAVKSDGTMYSWGNNDYGQKPSSSYNVIPDSYVPPEEPTTDPEAPVT